MCEFINQRHKAAVNCLVLIVSCACGWKMANFSIVVVNNDSPKNVRFSPSPVLLRMVRFRPITVVCLTGQRYGALRAQNTNRPECRTPSRVRNAHATENSAAGSAQNHSKGGGVETRDLVAACAAPLAPRGASARVGRRPPPRSGGVSLPGKRHVQAADHRRSAAARA